MHKPEYEDGQATAEERPEGAVTQEENIDTQSIPSVDTQSVPSEEDLVTTLRMQLEEKEKEAKANYDLFLRERAEIENFKRRMQREKSEALRFANEPLIKDILPVLDNLERAVAHAQSSGNGQPLIDGVSLILRSFLEALEKHGVSRISAKGQFFDPSKHEAMTQVETTEAAANTVIDEYAPAYVLHDRLLRPALVSVAKAPTEEKKSEA